MKIIVMVAGAALLAAPAGDARAGTGGESPRGPGECGHPLLHKAGAVVSDFWSHIDRNVEGTLTPPYRDTGLIYGYYDYRLGRGPVLTLGSRTLLPGFRGYGLLVSPGYGPGLRPTSMLDLDHFNGGPWYHAFPKDYLVAPDLNFDPGTPRRRF